MSSKNFGVSISSSYNWGDLVWGGMWGWIGSLADQKWPFLGLAKTGLAKAAMSELSP